MRQRHYLPFGLPECAWLIVLWTIIALLSLPEPLLAQENDEIQLALQASTVETDFTTTMAWGDVDNDGDLDLAVGNGMIIPEDVKPLLNLIRLFKSAFPAQLEGIDLDVLEGFFVKEERHNRIYCNDNGVLSLCWSSDENHLATGSEENYFTTSLAWGDADNDGDLDIAVANAGLGIKIINVPLIGEFRILGAAPNFLYQNIGPDENGNPQFVLTELPGGADSAMAIAWGDYDQDTLLDLATARSNHFMVIDYNNPRERPFYSNEPETNLVYHNDTLLDTSTESDADSTIDPIVERAISFSLSSQLPSESEVSIDIEWVDVNGDGALDLAVANAHDRPPSGNSAGLGMNRVYCNQEKVVSQPCWESSHKDFTISMSWGDIDDNGYPDMVAGNGQPWEPEKNRIYFNDGPTPDNTSIHMNGEDWVSTEEDASVSVALGDMDGDGDLDLAVGNGNFSANQPNRLYCNRNKVLSQSACWSSSEEDITMEVAWGDIDGDGALDLATGNISVPIGQQNRIYHNSGTKLSTSFDAWKAPQTAFTRGSAWGDMEGDGDLDLLLANSGFNQLYCNTGDALVLTSAFNTIFSQTRAAAWGDIDGDADLDVIFGNESGEPNRIYINQGISGECQPQFIELTPFSEDSNTRSLAWGDVDGDGDLDLATGNGGFNQFELPTGEPNHIYLNQGLGEDGLPRFILGWQSSEAEATRSVAWGDVDNDGDLDLAVANSANPSRLYRNDGMTVTHQLIFTPTWTPTQIADSHGVAWGDMNGDGYLDLAIGNTTQSNFVYCNQGGTLAVQDCWSSVEAERTRSIAWGDMDGDGDLDLAAGNQEGANQVYLNRNGLLLDSAVWNSDDFDVALPFTSTNKSFTLSIAWGDMDGDGDLDLVAGNSTGDSFQRQFSGIYLNNSRTISPSIRTANSRPPFNKLLRPGNTPDAPFYSVMEIITATEAVSIPYTLFSGGEDTRVRIYPEYSLNGPGHWQPATPGIGGGGVSNLQASSWPTGTKQVFVWDAHADLIKKNNVVFRIRTQNNQLHSPIFWPSLGTHSAPFRLASPWYVRVADNRNQPIENAELYADNVFITTTNKAGLVGPQLLDAYVGKPIVALAQQQEVPTYRNAHQDGLAYLTYQTTFARTERGLGMVTPTILTIDGEQRLTSAITMPLVLFNLVVALDWPADITYTQQISTAMHRASDYLYDLTDGQMAFRRVDIFTNARNWSDADIQISAKNSVHPYAIINGIHSRDRGHVIRLGRGWNGDDGNSGPWDQPKGYRTITHEFGHYGLGLYDEYFGYRVNSDGTLISQIPKLLCTGPENRSVASDATNASAMDRQYSTSELSDQGLPKLWGECSEGMPTACDCERTAQWVRSKQITGENESPWDTIARAFSDEQNPPRWTIVKPSIRGSILQGPTEISSTLGLPDWPIVNINVIEQSGPVRKLTVRGPNGPVPSVSVALHKSTNGAIIEQGFTLSDGTLDIYGAEVGDQLQALKNGLAGSLPVTDRSVFTMTLHGLSNSTNAPATLTQPATPLGGSSPYVRIVPGQPVAEKPGARQSDSREQKIALSFIGQNFDAPLDGYSTLSIVISKPGQETARHTQAAYSQTDGEYVGQLEMDVAASGLNQVQVIGSAENRLFATRSDYLIQRVDNHQSQTIFSSDGQLILFLNPGSFAIQHTDVPTNSGDDSTSVMTPLTATTLVSETIVVVTKQNTVPGPIPVNKIPVGQVYDITASGAFSSLSQNAFLTIEYDTPMPDERISVGDLGIYWWNPTLEQWELQTVDADGDEERGARLVSIRALGAYLIMAEMSPDTTH